MRASISALWVFLLLAGLCAAPADASRSDEHLELLSVEESIDDDGFSVFAGSVRNTSLVQAVIPHIYVVLKKDGVVVGRYLGRIGLEHIRGLAPSRSASFRISTEHEPGDYDEFHISLSSQRATIDPDSIEGNLAVVEESVVLTIGVYLLIEQTILYGELVNNTNAVVTDITVEFDLFDGRGRVLGVASTMFFDSLQFIELGPGETIDFAALVPRAAESRMRDWDPPRVSFRAVELVNQDVPTAITETTWGQVKHGRGQ